MLVRGKAYPLVFWGLSGGPAFSFSQPSARDSALASEAARGFGADPAAPPNQAQRGVLAQLDSFPERLKELRRKFREDRQAQNSDDKECQQALLAWSAESQQEWMPGVTGIGSHSAPSDTGVGGPALDPSFSRVGTPRHVQCEC